MPSKKTKYPFKLLIPTEHQAKTLFHDEKLAKLYARAVRRFKEVYVPRLIEDKTFDPAKWSTAGDQFYWVHQQMEKRIDFEYEQQHEALKEVWDSFRPNRNDPVRSIAALSLAAVEMANAGKSAAEISKMLGISTRAISHLKKLMGLVKKRKG